MRNYGTATGAQTQLDTSRQQLRAFGRVDVALEEKRNRAFLEKRTKPECALESIGLAKRTYHISEYKQLNLKFMLT